MLAAAALLGGVSELEPVSSVTSFFCEVVLATLGLLHSHRTVRVAFPFLQKRQPEFCCSGFRCQVYRLIWGVLLC